ncbi:class C sortase [Lacticaseibacillus parakribbianus]|uniref:class C sortase n=1 Tax=Lacticaseibacillus parakribbianus TaxID=2970927 RepID=UPI0021CB572E|nr:class C sortase [Lacticaseibacillus parakribbianus]
MAHRALLGPIDILLLIGLLVGTGFVAYPFVSDAYVTQRNQALLGRYAQRETRSKARADARQFAHYQAQNRKLAAANAQPGLARFSAAVADRGTNAKRDDRRLASETIARLTIPAIGADLPVFDQTTDWLLQFGACRLNGSSYPTGGAGTHAVISAHRGVPNATLFTHLPALRRGDRFYLTIGGRKLAYRVSERHVTAPSDVRYLRRVPGRDLVTLITCTPYMINSHRLLVTGERVPYTAADAQAVAATSRFKRLVPWLWAIGIAAFAWLYWRVARLLMVTRRDYALTLRLAPAAELQLRTGRFGRRRHVTADAAGNVRVTLPGATYRFHTASGPHRAYVRRIRDQTLTVR